MRNQNIAKVLKAYRKQNHLTVNDVSILLEERSFTAAPKTIYGWESGQANPSADILLTLCDLYNITDILEAFGYENNENLEVSQSLC
ncbi:MAG TPA: transcriptional regulator, partial [Roseburia sp.]|nr:transcriptional regulator [Roseburia sp.]